jgi:hypothetical protein
MPDSRFFASSSSSDMAWLGEGVIPGESLVGSDFDVELAGF